MTVGVDDELRIREYPGDNTATPRAYGFKILDPDDLRVTRTNADGSETVLVRGTHYSVSGAGNPTGGNVTPLAPIAAGTSWRIEGDMSLGQPTDYTAGDDFPAESHERGLDRSMIAHQEARRDLEDTKSRALMFPRGEIAGVLPSKTALAGRFIGGDAMGNPVALVGTGNDPDFRTDTADPTIGGRLFGHKSRLASAIARELDGKASERVSWLDLLPYAKHAPILEQTGNPDCAALLNAKFGSLPPGVEIFAPGRIIAEEPLQIPIGCSLVGERGRRDFDNSWDNGGGTVIEYQADTGDIFAFAQADVGNNRMAIALENLIIRGARVTRAGTATSGRGLVFNAPNQPGTAIHLYCRNVNVVECMEEGWWLEGPLYDVLLEYCGGHDNGHSARRVLTGGADAIGEFTTVNFRAFGCGALGAGHEQDGIWDAPGHTMVDVMLSASENYGNNVTKQSGLHTILGLQTEKLQTPGKSNLYIGSEGGGAGTGFCLVKGWKSNPAEAGHTGAHLWSTSDANQTRIEGVQFGDPLNTGAGGRHFITQGEGFHISGIRNITGSALTYLNQSNDAFIEGAPGRNLAATFVTATVQADVVNTTGNDLDYTIICNNEIKDSIGEYNAGSGVWTAKSKKRVRASAIATFDDIAVSYDRSQMHIICSDAAQSKSQRGGNPNAEVEGGSGFFTPLPITGIFDVEAGATLTFKATITGGPGNNATLKAGITRIEIEEIG